MITTQDVIRVVAMGAYSIFHNHCCFVEVHKYLDFMKENTTLTYKNKR